MFEIRTISHPTADSQYPLIMVQTQHGVKYLIGNVSEGTQRIMTSNTIRMGKIKGVFLTGKLTWRKLAGLPGLVLSVSDQGLKLLGLSYGNELLHYLVSSWRYFVFRKGMDLKCNVIDFEDGKCFEDELLKIRGFQVSDQETANPDSTFSLSSNNGSNETSNVGFKEARSIIQVFLNKLIGRMFPLDEPANIPNDKVEASETELTNYTKSDPNLNDSYVNTKLPKVPSINALSYSTNYLIEFHPVRGKFQKEKAIALGLKPGKIFAKLTNGESVTLEDGTVITPEQVISPKRFFNKVLVLDIVSETNLRNLLRKFQSAAATAELDSFKDVNLIYYFLHSSVDPRGKLFGDLLHFFQNKLNVENHVISHKNYTANSLNFEQAAAHVLKLKLLQPDNYRLPLFHQAKYDVDLLKLRNATKDNTLGINVIGEEKANENTNENESTQENEQRSFNVYALDRNEMFKVNHEMNIRRESTDNFFTKNRELPSDEFTKKYWKQVYRDEVETLKLDNVIPAEYVDTLLLSQKELPTSKQNDEIVKNDIQSQSHENQEKQQRFPTKDDIQELKDNVETITLGTGSAIPSVKRNVISTIVRIPTLDSSTTATTKTASHRAILLDAGENTIGSIKRIYNEHELWNFFANELKLVYLSHLHADHHLGIVSIIEEWCKYQVQKNSNATCNDNKNTNDDTLYVIAPWQYDYFLDDLKSLEVVNQHLYLTDKIRFISCEDFLLGRKLPEKKQEDAFELLAKLDKVETCNECEGPLELEMEAEMEIADGELENASSSPPLSSLSSSSQSPPLPATSATNSIGNSYVASGSSPSSYQNYKDQAPRNHELIDEIYKTLNINRILTCRAQHCRWSYCVTFDVSLLQANNNAGRNLKQQQQQQTSFKFSYSGDTRPTMAFVKIGSQSDLLIHEATLEDELLEMAIAKSHSTTSEAIIVGKRMNVEKLILTHFSQRYPKLPDVNTILSNEENNNYNNYGNDSYEYRYNTNRGDQKIKARTMDVEFAFDGLMIDYKDIGVKQKEILKDLDQIFSREEESEKLHSANLQQEEKSNRESKKKNGDKRKGNMKPNKKAKVSPPLQ